MNEFELEVYHNNTQFLFPAQLIQMGYSYKIAVEVDGVKVLFEPDEERQFRALVEEKDRQSIHVSLLQAIAIALHKALE